MYFLKNNPRNTSSHNLSSKHTSSQSRKLSIIQSPLFFNNIRGTRHNTIIKIKHAIRNKLNKSTKQNIFFLIMHARQMNKLLVCVILYEGLLRLPNGNGSHSRLELACIIYVVFHFIYFLYFYFACSFCFV
jgi:hypothetical protein